MRPFSAEDQASYQRLLAGTRSSPLSHTLAYRKTLIDAGAGDPRYLCAWEQQELRAVLPGFVKSSALGRVYNSLPLVQSPGGIVFAGDATADERLTLTRALVRALAEAAREETFDVCTFVATPYEPLPEELAEVEAELPHRYRMSRTTRVLELRAPLRLSHAAREALRKATAAEPQQHHARTEAEAHLVYDLYAGNMHRLGVVPRPWAFYQSLFRHAGPGGARFVWAEVAGQPTCAFVLLCHGDVVDYHSVGNTAMGRQLQIATWLCVQEISAARERGQLFWNWGVSPTPAVAAWKAHFGGAERSYDVLGFAGPRTGAWRRLAPQALSAAFPDHFVLPYDWLDPAPQSRP